MNNDNKSTTVREIIDYLKHKEPDIDINIVNSSVRHYRKNGLLRRKLEQYKRPFELELSNKGLKQLDWLEIMDDLLTEIND